MQTMQIAARETDISIKLRHEANLSPQSIFALPAKLLLARHVIIFDRRLPMAAAVCGLAPAA
jgi:hypothetical protein